MIRGLHGLIYSSDAAASRAFFRDVIKLPFSDVGEGWLIFDLPEGDLGFHPTEGEDWAGAGKHDVSFYCDDIHGTVAELKARGATFTQEVADHGYGLVTYFSVPGGITVQLYEPRYQKRRASKAKPAARKPAKAKAKAARKPAKAKAAARKGKAKPRGKRGRR